MLRALAQVLRTSAPSIYWRARNGVSLVQWCGSRVFGGRVAEDTAYDDSFWAFHDVGDWKRVAALIVDEFHPSSIADVGCGDGKLLAALHAVAPELKAVGFDGSDAAIAAARRRGVDASHLDLALTGRRSSAVLAGRVAECDIAVSLETAEHLPPWSAPAFVRALTRAPIVIFSAAQPLQGGTLHMNERPLEYWASRFGSEGFERHPRDAAFREAVSRLDLPSWYGRNIQVFRRRA